MRKLLIGFVPLIAYAHEGKALAPHDLVTAWAWDPLIVIGLFVVGLAVLARSSEEHGIQRWERWCYWGGWWSLVVALLSPLHAMGEVLFSAHMVQHEMLMLVAAPLLVLGQASRSVFWGMPMAWRKSVGNAVKARWVQSAWQWLTRPLNAWLIHAIALWGWHAPSLFQATLKSDLVHSLQHLSFLLVRCCSGGLCSVAGRRSIGYGMAVLYVFTTGVHSSILGALLTFSPRVWYPIYAESTGGWGLTALADQQIGGLIMWVPAGLVFLGAGLALFANWIRQPARVSGHLPRVRSRVLHS